jgi:uncharacterized protein GlcG (DUF336 family)
MQRAMLGAIMGALGGAITVLLVSVLTSGLLTSGLVVLGPPGAAAQSSQAAPSSQATPGGQAAPSRCGDLPGVAQMRGWLNNAAAGTGVSAALGPDTNAGGIFGGARMWGAVVNRQGELCAYSTSTEDPTQVWPIGQAIAKAKAYTANSVSLDDFVLSTARLYTLVQPGHSLFGLNTSNPFHPNYLAAPDQATAVGANYIAGGIITFGGGVPLYRNGRIIGALGVSGDTSCADHEIAKRVRDLAGLNPPGGPLTDDIIYAAVDGPSMFAHPLCPTTRRNGVPVGVESP